MLALMLPGCAGNGPPETIRASTPTSPTIAVVQQAPDTHIGQRMRWGGSILSVRNHPDTTTIEILARPLDTRGEPDPAAAGLGRFIAELAGFVDPAHYPSGRRLTVVGALARIESQAIGTYSYRYPVVSVESWYLWPDPPPVLIAHPPYDYPWYRPWYGPWYGPWRGPWYGPWY